MKPSHPLARSQPRRLSQMAWVCAWVWLGHAAAVAAPADLQASYAAQAGSPPSAARGQRFFNSRHGQDWQCSSCHGALPTTTGKHAATGKVIGPLAPAANPQRFIDAAKTEKWFRRNCNDVLGRECTPLEKADVLAWLIALQP